MQSASGHQTSIYSCLCFNIRAPRGQQGSWASALELLSEQQLRKRACTVRKIAFNEPPMVNCGIQFGLSCAVRAMVAL
jgi:hypothetical protein